MTHLQPDVKAAARYSISEASRLLGVHRNTLRRYTAEGAIKCGYFKSTMRKYYTGTEILKFWTASLL